MVKRSREEIALEFEAKATKARQAADHQRLKAENKLYESASMLAARLHGQARMFSLVDGGPEQAVAKTLIMAEEGIRGWMMNQQEGLTR